MMFFFHSFVHNDINPNTILFPLVFFFALHCGTQLFFREEVLEMFHHAYRSYMDNAYPADELMPLSCQGRYRGVTPSRGDMDDILGK